MFFVFIESMLPSRCSVSCNRCHKSDRNSISIDPICELSLMGGVLFITFFLSTSTFSLMLPITIMYLLPMFTWLMLTKAGLIVTMYVGKLFFVIPFEFFNAHLLPV